MDIQFSSYLGQVKSTYKDEPPVWRELGNPRSLSLWCHCWAPGVGGGGEEKSSGQPQVWWLCLRSTGLVLTSLWVRRGVEEAIVSEALQSSGHLLWSRDLDTAVNWEWLLGANLVLFPSLSKQPKTPIHWTFLTSNLSGLKNGLPSYGTAVRTHEAQQIGM